MAKDLEGVQLKLNEEKDTHQHGLTQVLRLIISSTIWGYNIKFE